MTDMNATVDSRSPSWVDSTVLFVDDDPQVLVALERTLGREPYNRLRASGGDEALELLGATPVKVVVVDQRMPGMSGSDLLVEIGRRWPSIGKIILTGHPGREVMVRGLEAEVDFLLYKPWNDETLRRAIRCLLAEVTRSRDKGADPAGEEWQDVGGEAG